MSSGLSLWGVCAGWSLTLRLGGGPAPHPTGLPPCSAFGQGRYPLLGDLSKPGQRRSCIQLPRHGAPPAAGGRPRPQHSGPCWGLAWGGQEAECPTLPGLPRPAKRANPAACPPRGALREQSGSGRGQPWLGGSPGVGPPAVSPEPNGPARPAHSEQQRSSHTPGSLASVQSLSWDGSPHKGSDWPAREAGRRTRGPAQEAPGLLSDTQGTGLARLAAATRAPVARPAPGRSPGMPREGEAPRETQPGNGLPARRARKTEQEPPGQRARPRGSGRDGRLTRACSRAAWKRRRGRRG